MRLIAVLLFGQIFLSCLLCSCEELNRLLNRISSNDNVLFSDDNMELTIDIDAAQSAAKKHDLQIRIFNTYDGATVCESKLADHADRGTK
jgi:hypothetical protein